MKKVYHFIMNPKASSGKGMKNWKKIEAVLKAEQISYKTHILQSAGETTELVRTLTGSGKDCHLVVVGGDGTINAVLNGVVDFEHTILSCIRTGSGNDFARNVGVSKNITKAITHLIHSPKKMCLDYGELCRENEQHVHRFIISSGIGYDADICEEVGRSRLKEVLNRIHLGKLVYVAIGVKQIFTRVNTGAALYMDDGARQNIPGLFFVVGMIHEKEGGGVPFCPDADASDGFLDICLVKSMPKWKLLIAVITVYMKKHYIFRDITRYKSKKLVVELQEKQWFHMDGEISSKVQRIEMVCRSGLQFYM